MEGEKELRCEACGRMIKPERDEKVERVTDADGVVRVFCELDLCRQERLQVHIRAFNARIAPERAGMESPPTPMVRICESCGREIKVERGEQSHPVLQPQLQPLPDHQAKPWGAFLSIFTLEAVREGSGAGEPPQHQAAHECIDHGLPTLAQSLVVPKLILLLKASQPMVRSATQRLEVEGRGISSVQLEA
jgi:hypothetical protein